MRKHSPASLIVATGADGRVGRLLSQELTERTSPANVRLCTPRDPATLTNEHARGFQIAHADYNDQASLDAAFSGAGTVLITSSDGANDVRIRQHRCAIDAAKKTNVGRVVYMSFTSPSASSLCTLNHVHADSEAYLLASGLTYTILRDNQFAENLELMLERSRGTNQLVLPGAHGKVAYIRRADAAAAIAGALTQTGHDNKTYELTGPEAVDLFEIAAALSIARGAMVTATEATSEEFGPVLAGFGLPPYIVEAMLSMYLAAAADEYALISQDAALLAGRPIEGMTSHVRRFA